MSSTRKKAPDQWLKCINGQQVDLMPFICGLVDANPVSIDSVDLAGTGNPDEYSISVTWTNAAGIQTTTTDATPVVISGAGHLDDDVETVTGTAVDNTDPRNPIVNVDPDSHPDDDVETVTGTAVDLTDPRNPVVNVSPNDHLDDDVETVNGNLVDDTDPRNPTVNIGPFATNQTTPGTTTITEGVSSQVATFNQTFHAPAPGPGNDIYGQAFTADDFVITDSQGRTLCIPGKRTPVGAAQFQNYTWDDNVLATSPDRLQCTRIELASNDTPFDFGSTVWKVDNNSVTVDELGGAGALPSNGFTVETDPSGTSATVCIDNTVINPAEPFVASFVHSICHPDGTSSSATNIFTYTPPPIGNIRLTKAFDVMEAAVGDTVTMTLTAGNDGTGPVLSTGANPLEVIDTFPSELTYVSDDGGASTLVSGNTITWNPTAPIAAGATQTLTVVFTVNAFPATGFIANSIKGRGDDGLGVETSDTAVATIRQLFGFFIDGDVTETLISGAGGVLETAVANGDPGVPTDGSGNAVAGLLNPMTFANLQTFVAGLGGTLNPDYTFSGLTGNLPICLQVDEECILYGVADEQPNVVDAGGGFYTFTWSDGLIVTAEASISGGNSPTLTVVNAVGAGGAIRFSSAQGYIADVEIVGISVPANANAGCTSRPGLFTGFRDIDVYNGALLLTQNDAASNGRVGSDILSASGAFANFDWVPEPAGGALGAVFFGGGGAVNNLLVGEWNYDQAIGFAGTYNCRETPNSNDPVDFIVRRDQSRTGLIRCVCGQLLELFDDGGNALAGTTTRAPLAATGAPGVLDVTTPTAATVTWTLPTSTTCVNVTQWETEIVRWAGDRDNHNPLSIQTQTRTNAGTESTPEIPSSTWSFNGTTGELVLTFDQTAITEPQYYVGGVFHLNGMTATQELETVRIVDNPTVPNCETLDGASNNFVEANVGAVDYSGQDWTVEFNDVVFSGAFPATGASVLLSQQDGTGTGRNWLFVQHSSGDWATAIGGAAVRFEAITPPVPGVPYSGFLSYDATADELTLWVNGKREVLAGLAMESADGDFILGADKNNGAASMMTGELCLDLAGVFQFP